MKKLLARVLSFVIIFEAVAFSAVFKSSAADKVAYNGHTYQVFDISMSWHDAKNYCESLGGYLAVITSQDEENYITQLLDKGGKTAYWIGLSDENNEGVWEWVTGEKYEYKNWAPNQPDNEDSAGNEDFVELCNTSVSNYKWMWNDNVDQPTDYTTGGHRFDQHGFICEWGGNDASTDSPTTTQDEITELLQKSIILSINSPCCYVWGNRTYVDKDNLSVMPIVKNNRTLVPIRFIAESLGGTVKWDGSTNTATIKSGNNTIRITTNSKKMYLNNKAVTLDVPAQNINGRTMIPLRALSETLNKQVSYYKGFIIVSDSNIILDTTNSDIQKMIEYIRYSMLVYDNQKSADKKSFMNKSVGKNNYYAIKAGEIPYNTQKNKLACVTSGIFIENISCTEKDSANYLLSMDVYNTMYSYGAVEVYSANGEWIKSIKINRYEGSPTSIKDTATSAWDATFGVGWALGKAIQGDNSELMYRNSTISECTNVSTTIPKGSFVYITNSITDSQYVLMYDIISVAVDSVSLGSDWIGSFSEDEKKAFLQTAKDKIMEKVSDKIFQGTISDTEFANVVAMDYSITEISDYVSSVTQKSLTVLSGLDIDVAEILKETAIDIGKDITIGTAEALFKKATAFIGTALDVCFNIGKTANYGCFISDIRKSMNSESLLLVVGEEANNNQTAMNFSIMQEYGGKIYTLHDFKGGQSLPKGINEYINANKYDLVQTKYDLIVKNFAIYKDKIYYLVSEDGTDYLKGAICCCDLDGQNNKLLADNLINYSLARIEKGMLYYESYNLKYGYTGNGSAYISDAENQGVGCINLNDLSRSTAEGDLAKYFYDNKSKAPVQFESDGRKYYGNKKSVYCHVVESDKTYIIGTFNLSKVYSITILESYDNYIYCKVITDTEAMSQHLYNTRLYKMNTDTGKYEYLTSWHTS
jgi:hypothetical protein